MPKGRYKVINMDDKIFEIRYYRNSKKISKEEFVHILYQSLLYKASDNITDNLREFTDALNDSIEYMTITNPRNFFKPKCDLFHMDPELINDRKIHILFRYVQRQAQLHITEGKHDYIMKVEYKDTEQYDSITSLCGYLVKKVSKMGSGKEFIQETIKQRIDSFKEFAEGK